MKENIARIGDGGDERRYEHKLKITRLWRKSIIINKIYY